ncbi:DNA-3-methyladenine glycosylase 2 family protein [Actinomadura kijaniata]|uniref:DNA-3-methyladenine glycosylase 2 family protein n=1 Tax=Actinomadura kijaniata TaxID=46161 RepID=UPI00082B69EC|nr:AlkA N-terminal domain-containing protein [Actinomadura kijaniata]
MIAEEDVRRAVESRDPRFDGWLFVAVTTTGVYCRPSCPAVMPRPENLRVFPSAAAAQVNGFRACKRCRPDASPGSPEWNSRADLVGRAMRLIADGVVDREGVAGLAGRLGYSRRQIHRQLVAEVGAGPQALARAQRAQTARLLLETTALPVSDVAFAAGFASIRQFNETVRRLFATTPTALRNARARSGAAPAPGVVPLRLAYRPPLDVPALLGFLGARPLPGVEEYADGVFRRSLSLPHGPGTVALWPVPGADHVGCEIRLADLRDLTTAVQRCRRLLDLDADQRSITAFLEADPLLRPLVAARPGRRVPGHPDAAELAARLLLDGDAALATLIRRHAEPLPVPVGAVTHLFPDAAALATLDHAGPGAPPGRGEALRALAAALAGGDLRLDPGADRRHARRRLLDLPGFDPLVVDHIRMRVLGDPDVFPARCPKVRHALRRLSNGAVPADVRALSECWRPWRSYATQHLWAGSPAPVISGV